MADTPVINAQNPWPWLAPFTEDAAEFFNGRDEDADHLLRGVYASPVSVLFGKSGQGKTSLLQAGLAPRLRGEHLLPVVVRISYGRDDSGTPPSVSGQLQKRLLDETVRYGLHWRTLDESAPPAADPRDHLWEWLHDGDGVWRDISGERWQPVFILDQFEEIFTLLDDDTQRRALFEELGDLLENRIPPGVAARIRADATLRNRLDPDSQPYRVVIALREDYLPDLEEWAALIPRLGPNRYRLQAMTREQAQQAVAETGKALVTPEDAERILDYLLRRNVGEPGRARPRQARRIDPAILSLLCSGLNAERLAQNPPPQRLQLDGLEQAGERILERFYDDAFKTLAEAERAPAQRFVFENLITDDGARRPYPRQSAPGAGLSEAALRELVQRRLLRIEADSDDEQIELVHDRLAAIALERRRQAAKAEQEARRRRQKRMKLGTGLALLGVALWISLLFMTLERKHEKEILQQEKQKLNLEVRNEVEKRKLAEKSQHDLAEKNSELERQQEELSTAQQVALVEKARAVKARDEATQEARHANVAEGVAKEKAREAIVLRLIAEGAPIASGDSRGGPIRGLLTVLAAHRLAHGTTDAVRLKTYAALQNEAHRFEGLVFIRAVFPLRDIEYSPDGSRIVTYHRDTKKRVWDADKVMPLGETTTDSGPLNGRIASSADGKRRVSISAFRDIRQVEQRNGTALEKSASGENSVIFYVAYSPDGKNFITGEAAQGMSILQMWDADTLTRVGKSVGAHNGIVSSITYSRDGKLVASSGSDRTLRLWEVSKASLIPLGEPIKGHLDTAYSLADRYSAAISPDNLRLASGGDDGTLRVWDLPTIYPREYSTDQRYLIHGDAQALSSDGRHIATAHRGGVQLWNTQMFTTISRHLGENSVAIVYSDDPHNTAGSIALNQDGKRVAVGSLAGTIQRWDAATGKKNDKPIAAHVGEIRVLTFSPDGNKLASAGAGANNVGAVLRLWDAATGKLIGEPMKGHTDKITSVQFSPDGRRILSASLDGTLKLWNAETGEALTTIKGQSGPIFGAAFSPDGRHIASAEKDGNLRLWNSESGVLVGRTLVDKAPDKWTKLALLAFSPDGRYVAFTSAGHPLRLWDTLSGALVGEPIATPDWVLTLAYSPDGKHIVSAHGREPRTFPVLEGWADALCAKLERNMSRSEWREWVSPDIDYVKQCPDLPVPAD